MLLISLRVSALRIHRKWADLTTGNINPSAWKNHQANYTTKDFAERVLFLLRAWLSISDSLLFSTSYVLLTFPTHHTTQSENEWGCSLHIFLEVVKKFSNLAMLPLNKLHHSKYLTKLQYHLQTCTYVMIPQNKKDVKSGYHDFSLTYSLNMEARVTHTVAKSQFLENKSTFEFNLGLTCLCLYRILTS